MAKEVESLAKNEQFLYEHAKAAYFKACESSDPQDWMQAALLAQQHRNAVDKLLDRKS